MKIQKEEKSRMVKLNSAPIVNGTMVGPHFAPIAILDTNTHKRKMQQMSFMCTDVYVWVLNYNRKTEWN